jgi:hypothetical protein
MALNFRPATRAFTALWYGDISLAQSMMRRPQYFHIGNGHSFLERIALSYNLRLGIRRPLKMVFPRWIEDDGN